MANLRRLEAVLKAERNALIRGDYRSLAEIARAKEEAIAALRTQTLDKALWSGIATKLERNAKLIAAAQSGLETVARRMKSVSAARSGFDAYGPGGRSTRVGPEIRSHERKA